MSKNIFDEIKVNNEIREERELSEYACLSNKGLRKRKEHQQKDSAVIRPMFFRDTDRIIHSSAYTRYIDKTQVFYLFENDHLTHRVLHVQFVAKIGRVIGRALRLNEDLIEAIALGHDLGHVPYGHDGERILDSICRDAKIGSFAHNVQSVRSLNELENNGKGLNLSLQVLDGILCHNGELLTKEYRPNTGKTWEDFEAECEKCLENGHYSRKILPMTLEGCVMRISDVIGYIGRDIEDAVRLRVIHRKDIPQRVQKVLGSTNDKIIDSLVVDLVEQSYGKDYLSFSDEVFEALQELMKFNYKEIYACPAIKTQDKKIVNMFVTLFDHYCEALENNDTSSPICKYFASSKDNVYLDKTDNRRVVVDFIAGMTDDYFNNQFKQLFVPQSFGYSLTTAQNVK